MNRYLMRIEAYFSGWDEFEIEAENKQDAIDRFKYYKESDKCEFSHSFYLEG